MRSILQYHVVPGLSLSDSFVDGQMLLTAQGDMVTLTVEPNSDDNFLVNGAQVLRTDILASNGIIHAINAVLLPPVEAGDETETPVTTTDEPVITDAPVSEEDQTTTPPPTAADGDAAAADREIASDAFSSSYRPLTWGLTAIATGFIVAPFELLA